MDWARINEMPQWFVVRPEREYSVRLGERPSRVVQGRELIEGLAVEVTPGQPTRVRVRPKER